LLTQSKVKQENLLGKWGNHCIFGGEGMYLWDWNGLFRDQPSPVGKTSACLREAASAKAGANLLIKNHGRSCPSLWISHRVRYSLSPKILDRPWSDALESGLPIPVFAAGGTSLETRGKGTEGNKTVEFNKLFLDI